MAANTYYVGPGGNNANAGTSYALRKLTLNGAEDIPVVSGDLVIVAPGVYRELLTTDVSGGSLYSTGTVSVTNGSAVITGSGTTWSGNTFVDGIFQVRGLSLTGYTCTFADSPYEILSVDSNTQITLKTPYQGASASGLAYKCWRDIKYVADLTGALTDGIGGECRITGSDNDLTSTRANCITCTTRDYRTFRGFSFDTCTGVLVNQTNSTNNGWIIEDCVFRSPGSNSVMINFAGAGTNQTIRRCLFWQNRTTAVNLAFTSNTDNIENLVEACVMIGATSSAVALGRYGGVRVRNITTIGCGFGVRMTTAPNVGQTNFIHNCEFYGGSAAIQGATVVGTNEDLMENYNNLFGNSTDRTNCNVGANSTANQPFFALPLLTNKGVMEPFSFLNKLSVSGIRDIAGSNPAPYDLWGAVKGTVGVNGSWGGVQSQPFPTRESSTIRNGLYSHKIPGRGSRYWKFPTTANQAFTVTAWVRWDDNSNIGTKPRIRLIADYGVSEQTSTASGTGATWEKLTVSGTPNTTGFMFLALENQCSYSADIAAYFDDLQRT